MLIGVRENPAERHVATDSRIGRSKGVLRVIELGVGFRGVTKVRRRSFSRPRSAANIGRRMGAGSDQHREPHTTTDDSS